MCAGFWRDDDSGDKNSESGFVGLEREEERAGDVKVCVGVVARGGQQS